MTIHALLKKNMQRIAYTGNQWVFLQVLIECRGDLSGSTAGRNVFGQRPKLQAAKTAHKKSLAGRVWVTQVLWSKPYLWGVVLVRKHDSSVKRNQINGIGVTMGISLVNHDPNLACGFKIGSIALHMLRVP